MVNYLPENPIKYYKDLPFLPGLDFYRAIGEVYINVNSFGTFIPDTMVSMGKLIWIQWEPGSDEFSGKNLIRENDFVLLNFAEHLKNVEMSLYNRNPLESTKPIAIEKKLSNSYFNATEKPISWSSLVP